MRFLNNQFMEANYQGQIYMITFLKDSIQVIWWAEHNSTAPSISPKSTILIEFIYIVVAVKNKIVSLCNSILQNCNSTNPADPVYQFLCTYIGHTEDFVFNLNLCLASNSKNFATLISSSCLVLALALSIYSTQKQQQKPNSEKCVFLLLYGKAKQSSSTSRKRKRERETTKISTS